MTHAEAGRVGGLAKGKGAAHAKSTKGKTSFPGEESGSSYTRANKMIKKGALKRVKAKAKAQKRLGSYTFSDKR